LPRKTLRSRLRVRPLRPRLKGRFPKEVHDSRAADVSLAAQGKHGMQGRINLRPIYFPSWKHTAIRRAVPLFFLVTLSRPQKEPLNSESFGSKEALREGVETGGRGPNAAACGQQTTRDWGGSCRPGPSARRILQCARRQVCQVSPAESLHGLRDPQRQESTHCASARRPERSHAAGRVARALSIRAWFGAARVQH